MYLSTKTLPNDVSINTVMKIKQEGFFDSVMVKIYKIDLYGGGLGAA